MFHFFLHVYFRAYFHPLMPTVPLALMLDICPSHKSSWPKYDSHAQCDGSQIHVFSPIFPFLGLVLYYFLNSTLTVEFFRR